MSSTARTISNTCAGLLVLFAAFCLQGHLTSALTPGFAAQIAASIHPHNQKVFYPLGLSDDQLNLMMAAINVVNIVSLVVPSWRRTGFAVNAGFYSLGWWATRAIGESVAAHNVLIGTSVLGLVLRR